MSATLRKAMVLAAGFGRRLRPLTVVTAKPALPLMGRPLIEYVLRRLARCGIEEAVVNLHHQVDTVTPSLERAPEGLTIHRSLEPELLGTAGGLKRAECHFSGEDAFILMNADTLVDVDIDAMMRVHRDSGALATLLLRPKPSGSPYSTVLVGDDGRIRAIVTGRSDGDWMFAGVWILSPAVLDRLSGAAAGLEKELLPSLIAEGSAAACRQDATWITIDTPKRYWGACLTMARERLFQDDWSVEPVSDAGGAGPRARVWMGRGSRIDRGADVRSEVVLGASCHVARGAFLERTVCWDDVHVPKGVRLENCVVTRGVRLPAGLELSNRLVMQVADAARELRKREIRDDLLIASLDSGRTRGL